MKKEIEKCIIENIKSLQEKGEWPDFEIPHIVVERPKDVLHGDWTTNVGFVLARFVRQSPEQVATALAHRCSISGIADCSVAGGYINFTYERLVHSNRIKRINQEQKTFFEKSIYPDKKILVEHSSPNLFKPFHIGHLVNNTIGESVVRLMRQSGGEVVVVSYPSDVSLGIAKAVWAVMQKGSGTLFDDKYSMHEKMVFAGTCYAYGTQQYDENEDAQKEIRTINQQIYAQDQTEAYEIYQKGRELNLAYFITITQQLGSHFDGYIFESEAGRAGKEIVEQNTPGIFTESNGAVIYEGEQDGLHTRVFLNKEHLPTYEAKDIGLLSKKFDLYNPDLSLFVTDHEQKEYFKVVLAAAQKIHPRWSTCSQHITHGRLRFSSGKVSSRLGNVPLAEEVLDTIRTSMKSKVEESVHARAEAQEDIVDILAIGALKFAILKTSLGKNMVFDEEEAMSFEGDSGPYVQYTHARTCSVVANASHVEDDGVCPEDTMILERKMEIFGEVVERAICEVAPHHVVSYLLDLSREFNAYYARQKIVSDDPGSFYRVQIARAVGLTLKEGLDLLGIQAPQKM